MWRKIDFSHLSLYLDIARNFVFTASNYFFDFTKE